MSYQTAGAGATPSVAMRRTALVARILLGLLFVLAGGSGFYLVFSGAAIPPSPTPLATEFQDVIFRSHFVLFVDGVQLIAGLLLLTNRYVPLALVALAAVIANILAFHLSMAPSTIVLGLVALVLWVLVALRHRASFAPLLQAKPEG
jgi:putative oxidoreductase